MTSEFRQVLRARRPDASEASIERPFSTTVAGGLTELLRPWIGCAFTVPGAGNLPFISAWSARGLRWVTALEEKRGLTMAEGYVRAGGQLALMSTTAGPGATNLSSALALALREQTPVFVVTGQTPRGYATRLPVQELDTKSFARELTLAARELTAPEQLEGVVRELVRVALHPCRKGPVLLAVPADLWQAQCLVRGWADLASPWSIDACSACARALRAARHPLIIAGSGIVRSGLSASLSRLVELLPNVRVAATPRALGVFPSSHRQYVGAVGRGHSAVRGRRGYAADRG